MTTYLVMQNRIADEMVRDDLAGQIQKAINDAIQVWEGIRFTFNERKFLINTVASEEYYDIDGPDNDMVLFDGTELETGETLLEIDTIRITVNNSFYPLTARTQGWFSRYASLPSQYLGQPDSYTIFNNQIRLYPVPDGVYPINIDGLARLGPFPLVNDEDTSPWMVAGEMLIRQQAKYILYRDIVRDAEGKQNATEGIQEAQFHLERKGVAKLMTGTQRAWNL